MNDQEKLIRSIVKDINLENKGKHEIIYILSGLLSNTILTKIIFENNSDIKEFTNSFLGKNYKDYLFRSRTLLYSRLIKDSYRFETDQLRKEANQIINFITESLKIESEKPQVKQDGKKKRKSGNYNSDAINSWREIINPKKGSD